MSYKCFTLTKKTRWAYNAPPSGALVFIVIFAILKEKHKKITVQYNLVVNLLTFQQLTLLPLSEINKVKSARKDENLK
jgi:hypothetical protein